MKRVIFTLLFACLPAFSQTAYNYVATTGAVVLVAATTAATLQQPANTTSQPIWPVSFPASPAVGASVYCSVPCTASLIIGAGAASTTAGTVNAAVLGSPKASVKFFTASNYSGGTTLVAQPIAAGQVFTFDLGPMKLGGPSSNITIAISSISGTANITFYPIETH